MDSISIQKTTKKEEEDIGRFWSGFNERWGSKGLAQRGGGQTIGGKNNGNGQQRHLEGPPGN